MDTYTRAGITIRRVAANIEMDDECGENTLKYAPWISATEQDALAGFFEAERDEELNRWRSPDYPDYVIYPKSDDGVLVLNERSPTVHQVRRGDEPNRHPYYAAARAYFREHPAAPPLPTEPGIYVPGRNVDRLGASVAYRLSKEGTWAVCFQGDEDMPPAHALRHAEAAHRTLGGLVRLTPEGAR